MKSTTFHRFSALPVFMCGFRPFFVLTALSAVIMPLLWLLMLGGMLPDTLPGGGMLWHAHELIFGFVTASIAGFVLTAIPEFTHTRAIAGWPLARLALLWLAARLAYLLAGVWPAWLGLWPAAVLNLGLWGLLLMQITPAVWQAPERRHVSFFWTLGAMAVLQAGYFVALAQGGNPMAWLRLTVGVVMILIVIAASRVSMAVVNGLVERKRPGQPDPGEVGYLARPPRRKLAIFCIGLCSVSEFTLGGGLVTGWTALAAAAAMLNLLNDWHVGKPLLKRWPLMMYAFYWLMAIGYALMGAAWMGAPLLPSAGRHVLMAGAMGLSILTIMSIAGRIHAGRWLDRRAWLPLTAALMVGATLLRAAAGSAAAASWSFKLLAISGVLWAACFAVYLLVSWPVLTGPRPDGLSGCQEPQSPDTPSE